MIDTKFRNLFFFCATVAVLCSKSVVAEPGKVPPTASADGSVSLEARVVPLPGLISPAAREALKEAYARRAAIARAPSNSTGPDAIAKAIEQVDSAYENIADQLLLNSSAAVERTEMDSVVVYVGTPENGLESRENRAVLYVHGGGFIYLSGGKYAQSLAAENAQLCACTVYSVNYRTPPDHPFPAAIDDIVAVYRQLLKRYEPQNIAIAGESAGGNIAAGATLKIRDSGLAMPGMVILLTPSVDLTRSGDSMITNMGLDARLAGDSRGTELYANGHSLRDPYLSPVFGDFTRGYPPTFVQAGLRDLLLSGAVVIHRSMRRAGIDAELHVWEGQSHGPFAMVDSKVPEDIELKNEIRRFLNKHWESTDRAMQ